MNRIGNIRIAVAVMKRADGRMLLVRKRGTIAFMQPGGKIEDGEAPEVALSRELFEELGLAIAPEALDHVGRYFAPAANEPGRTVEAEVHVTAPIADEVTPGAEIEELAWIDGENQARLVLAPLTRDEILPRHLPRGSAE